MDTWPTNPSLLPHSPYVTPHRPLHLVEICAGIATGLEAFLRAGHHIASYTWADINPDAHAATSHRLQLLHRRFHAQLPSPALRGWDRRLPFNANCLSPTVLCGFPAGIDIVIAGPPCQPYSAAGRNKGLADPRSQALLQVTRLIHHLQLTQPNGVGYILENVPGTDKHPAIAATLDVPLHLDAPPCGSGAKRETLFWQNLADPTAVQQSFDALPTPTTPINDTLSRSNLQDWHTQPLTAGYNMPPSGRDAYNTAGKPQVALPKFVCFPRSHKYRFHRGRPGPGLLIHHNSLMEPSADIRELLMGFHIGDTAAPTLAETQRRHLLGQCIDVNLLSWLVRTTSPPTTSPQSPTVLAPPSPPPLSLA